MDILSPIVATFTSISSHDITGRGRVIVVPNPRDTNRDGGFGWLMGQWVRIDGDIYRVRGVEAFAIGGTYAAGRPIGLLVTEVEETDTVL